MPLVFDSPDIEKRMRRLVCAFIVLMRQDQVIPRQGLLNLQISYDMRFPTIWYARAAKALRVA